jgi:ABC-type nitrate/sulfonate/bicarbonate transport system substrate-binding protein
MRRTPPQRDSCWRRTALAAVLGVVALGAGCPAPDISSGADALVARPTIGSLAAGVVDALVTFEPHRARLLAGGARLLFDSSQIPGEIRPRALDAAYVRRAGR